MSLEAAINAIPTMLTIWGAVTACFVAILTYRGQLTRYEQERLFLSNTSDEGARKQSEIVHRIKQIQPYVRILGAATTLITVTIVAIWTLEQARPKDPRNPSLNRALAELYERRGNFTQAIALWEMVRKARPGDDQAHGPKREGRHTSLYQWLPAVSARDARTRPDAAAGPSRGTRVA